MRQERDTCPSRLIVVPSPTSTVHPPFLHESLTHTPVHSLSLSHSLHASIRCPPQLDASCPTPEGPGDGERW